MSELKQKRKNENHMNNNNGNNGGEEQVKKKNKRKEVAPYGNYRNYYGYRVGSNVEEDPRFKVFKKEWFEGKDCIDVGCNSGLITINIAEKFNCRSILGIDIDHGRVNDAVWHLRNIVRKKKTGNKLDKASNPNGVNHPNNSEYADDSSSNPENLANDSLSADRSLVDIVSFQCENFALNRGPLPLEYYDTVICLSVTKWVQLNWGDEGLITLFGKIWRLLRPGGIFILEPQPWESYYKNRLTTEVTQKNYSSISLKPDYFQELLLDKIGFRTVEHATSSVSDAATGFNRPVLVFRK